MNSQDNRWTELDQQEEAAKQIIALLDGSPLKIKCDTRKRVDGWRVAFRELSETEARHIVAAVAASPQARGIILDAGTF
jgi:hypothetical protein